jgi:hypothetical protein
MTSKNFVRRNGSLWLGLMAVALVGGALMLMPGRSSAQAPTTVNIPQLTLSGANEVPPVEVNATGFFSATVTANSLTFDLSANGDQFTMAHIHLGAAGTNGPIVAFLYGPADPTSAIHPTGTITQANLVGPLAGNWAGFADALRQGNLYVNAHSTDHPAGSIRAQIPATNAPGAATTPTAAASATPVAPSTGTGLMDETSSRFALMAGFVLLMGAVSLAGAQVARRRA